MRRIRTDSVGAAAGFQGTVEDAALPVPNAKPGSAAGRQTVAGRGLGMARLTGRMLRDAAMAVAMMMSVPIALVAVRGDTLFRQSNFSAYVHQNLANADAVRAYGVPADASISPIAAGRAFAALQPVKEQAGYTPTLPAVRAGPSWRDAHLTAAMFPGARPDFYPGTSSRTILGEAAKGLSAPELDYLRVLANGWEWRDFDLVARAQRVDMLGGQLQLPFAENAYPEMRPAQFKQIRETACAAVSRAAYHVAIGQRDSAETILRSIVSVGLAMIDNGPSAIDEMIGSVIVGVGRDALRQFYVTTSDARAIAPELTKSWKRTTPAERIGPPLAPTEIRQRLIANVGDHRIPMGERFESLDLLARASCTNVRELMFGPRDEVRQALDAARSTLARFPSERALVDVNERLSQPSLSDVSWNPITTMAVSAATVPGVVLRNPRLAACTRLLASW
ncbi:hypothetical protein BH11GEM2_BH11GEM2_28480 [soil metagenome]